MAEECAWRLEAARSGAPRRIGPGDAAWVLTLTLFAAPLRSAHWSACLLAEECEMSASSVSRIWKGFGLPGSGKAPAQGSACTSSRPLPSGTSRSTSGSRGKAEKGLRPALPGSSGSALASRWQLGPGATPGPRPARGSSEPSADFFDRILTGRCRSERSTRPRERKPVGDWWKGLSVAAGARVSGPPRWAPSSNAGPRSRRGVIC